MALAKYQQELKLVAEFDQEKQIDVKLMPVDLLAALIKRTRTKKKLIWVFNKGIYTKWKVGSFFRSIKSCTIYKLQLCKNYQKNVLKDIMHIKFTYMRFLFLQFDWINNIEALCYIDAPFLREINLRNNEIAELRSLRKLTLPNFTTLRINLHESISNFSELNLYNRHNSIIARELMNYHSGSLFSDRIKRIINRKRSFYHNSADQEGSSESSSSSESD